MLVIRNFQLLRVVFLVLVASPLTLTGCNVMRPFSGSITLLNAPDAPLAGPDGRASNDFGARWDFVRAHERTDWVVDKETRVNAFEAANRVHARLDREGEWLDEETAKSRVRYPTRVTIVCAEPVVAIVEPIPVEVLENRVEGVSRPAMPLSPWWRVAPADIALPHGVRSGDRVATREQTMWIDLSSFDEPRPIVPGDDGVARLPVAWGQLRLEPAGDGWRVRAEPAELSLEAAAHAP